MKNALLALSLFIGFFVHADEGMWFLMFIERLNQRDMEKLGLQLTAEEIYSINHSSLKDAVVQFNGGCTAELISSQGLVLTITIADTMPLPSCPALRAIIYKTAFGQQAKPKN